MEAQASALSHLLTWPSVAGPLDVLSSSSIPYLKLGEDFGLPVGLSEKGIDIQFHHIGQSIEPVTHSAGFKSTPTTTIDKCPKLDYLLIGGPEPSYINGLPPAMASFIRERSEQVKILFTTCSGGMVAAAAGVLTGKNATTNHGIVPIAKQMMPHVKWTAEKQWVIDGKFW